MSGSELFWQSGTWLFFVGQLAVMVLVVWLYFAQGKAEQRAIEKARKDSSGE